MSHLTVKSSVLVLAVLFSCMDRHDNFVKKRVPVDVYEISIPTTAASNQDVPIQLKARATNGCYADLEIKMTEVNDRHFLFEATGLYQSHGICPDMMVYSDTTIIFKPTLTGKYYFQTNEAPFEIRKDTITIQD